MKIMDQYMGYVIAVSTATLAAVWWLMNNILTNKSEIKLLKHQNDITNKLLDELRNDQKEMRRDIQSLLSK
tara:strand:- start:117 stop:329 length:213 start_codon:yes stop_codon:yes gene_type:complete